MIIQTQVGPQSSADGTYASLRGGKQGEGIVSELSPRLYEQAYRGNVFLAANQTGVTTQAGLSATTPALTLFNPKGNGKNLVLLFAGCVETVANAAASIVWLGININTAAAAVTGTAVTNSSAAAIVTSALLGNNSLPSASVFTAATLPAAPVAVATLGTMYTGAITTIPYQATLGRWFDGSIIVTPGAAVSFQTSTASGASGFFGEFIWQEVAV